MKPGYKQTELGIIPQEWVITKLGSLGTVIRGASPRPKGDRRFYGGDVPRLMVEDVTRDGKFVTPQIDYLTSEGAKRSRPCKQGTLTIVCSGTPSVVGKPSFLAVDACIHDGMLALTSLSNKVVPDYLFHQLTSFQEKLFASATHGGTFINLTTEGLRDFSTVLPAATTEQRAIAEALSDVDALLDALDRLIAKKRDVKQATMQQLLTGRKRLPGFQGKWEMKRLGELGVFLKGSGIRKDEANCGPFPCIRYGEIYTKHHNCIREFGSFISAEIASGSTLIKAGDILFAGSGETKEEIGKCVAFLDDFRAYAGGDIVILRTNGHSTLFLGYCLNTPPINVQKASRGQGDAVVHISASSLANIRLHLPPPPEQAAIAEVLSDMDAEIVALERRREKTRALKQGMMQELLTGRTRLVPAGDVHG